MQQEHDELSRVCAWRRRPWKEWEQTIDRVDDMLFLADPDRRIGRCNRTFRNFIGRSYAEILGQPFDRLLSEAGVAVDPSLDCPVECFHERTGKWFVVRPYPLEEVSGGKTQGTIVDDPRFDGAEEGRRRAHAEESPAERGVGRAQTRQASSSIRRRWRRSGSSRQG